MPKGDCYMANGRIVMHKMSAPDAKKWILCHGVGILQSDGKPFGHAWVENGSRVIDQSNGNDINLTATTDINVPSGVGMTFGNDGEKIEGDGTDLTISGNNINLTATADVVIPANVGITFGRGEKIEGDSTNLTITSGADIALTATSDINVPSGVGMTFGDDGEKIEGDGTDLTILSSGVLNLAAGGTTNQIKITDGAILPITDSDINLGSATYEFNNAWFSSEIPLASFPNTNTQFFFFNGFSHLRYEDPEGLDPIIQ